jgi:hypothetical protein
MSSIEEKLTEQFLRWELRGRGWQLWSEPVVPEPAFRPFTGHYAGVPQIIDDSRKPSGLGSFLRGISDRLTGEKQPASIEENNEDESEPRFLSRGGLIELQTFVPATQAFSREAYAYFLASVSACREPVTFELVGNANRITAQLVVHPADVALVREQLATFFPDVATLPKENYLRETWAKPGKAQAVIVECGLAKEFMLPLALGKVDPLVPLVGALGELGENEVGVFQVIFGPVRHPWSESIIQSVTDGAGDAFFVNAPALFSGAKQKISRLLYAAVLRVAVKSSRTDRVTDIARNIIGALGVFENPEGNHIIPLKNDGYVSLDHEGDMLRRESHRSGMLLNSDELINLVHLPSADVHSTKLRGQTSKSKAAPAVVLHDQGLVLGSNVHLEVEKKVVLTPEQRMRHVHIIGASGTGKSTLFFNCIRQDIESGRGVALLDPHGDLVDRILGIIPPERIDDVVLLDPSDLEFPVGFNILHAHSELEKTLLASDLVSVFERLSKSWGDQMGSVLSNAILAFLESDKGGSLSDLRRFLLEPAFRDSFLATVRDPGVVYYWRKGFPVLSGNKSIGPVLTRLETFLTPKSIRYMVSQTENKLDFAQILDGGKIFLAKLSQGAIGKENSYLLGTLLVSKLQQLAMSRQAQEEAQRRDFYLYIDEFHNFITPSMAEILSGARKYRLGLVLAHQDLRQLERDREVASAVVSNSYTRVCFRVGDQDARALENGFTSFEARDLQNLGTGSAICRVERSDFDFNLAVPNAVYPPDTEAATRRREVIAASRAKYATPRAQIEAALNVGQTPPPPAPTPPPVAPVKPPPPPPAKPASPLPVSPPIETKVSPAPVVETPVAKQEPASPGRGGQVHKQIQALIKQWAEGMGYRATIEKQVLNGSGSIDVALEKGTRTIACEISITTPADQEIGNVKKCVSAGFQYVFLICSETERVEKMKRAVSKGLSREEQDRTRFCTPEELFTFVQEIEAKEASGERSSKGYKVKVNYRALNVSEREEAERTIAQALVKSAQRNVRKV